MDLKVFKWCEQDYNKLKQVCLQNGKLFVDPKFTAFIQEYPDCKAKRPTDICATPHFFLQHISRLDIQQGELGDCWMVSAVITLSQHPKMLERVVPLDQNYSKNYAGIFRFRFCQDDTWVEVVVDDRLLVKQDKLKFARSTKRCEYWIALLEKAYAKLYGSYKKLEGGYPEVAMEDLTGGIAEEFVLKKAPDDLFQILYKSSLRKSLLTATIKRDGQEGITRLGLVKGHAYSITKVHVVEHSSLLRGAQLLRIKNPWANKTEWRGAWSDRSSQWNAISPSERDTLGLVFEDDGEFWISFEDFQQQFTTVNICHMSLDSLSLFEHGNKTDWNITKFEGSFKNKKRYIITLTKSDENDSENKCTLIVSLMQKSLGQNRLKFYEIAISIYDLQNHESIRLDPFINSRNIVKRYRLPPGRYAVEPVCNNDGSRDYLLHIYTEQEHAVEATKTSRNSSVLKCCVN